MHAKHADGGGAYSRLSSQLWAGGVKMLEGKCHCGKVAWWFDGMPESSTACNCTLCRRYGTLWAYDFEGERIRVAGPTRVYSWGDGDIGFHFCEHCGNLAYWRGIKPRDDGRRRMAVNLRLAEKPEAVAAIPIRHFDGFESWKDVTRDGANTVGEIWF